MILVKDKGLLNRIKRAFLLKSIKEEIYKLNNKRTNLTCFDIGIIQSYFGYSIGYLENEEGTQGKISMTEDEIAMEKILDRIGKKS